MAAGYSATPLAKKLGVRAGSVLSLLDAPAGWAVPELPPDVTVISVLPTEVDMVVAFCRSRAVLGSCIAELGAAILPDRIIWIAWPRRAAGHRSDLDENGIREVALPLGLVDVKVAAIDTDWSGLKLVWRTQRRHPAR